MKISKWEELNGKRNGSFIIKYQDGTIIITMCTPVSLMQVGIIPYEEVLVWLKLFGFDVEFEEQPKLSKREYHFVNCLDESYWIARHADMGIYVYNAEPKNGSNGIWTPAFWQERLLDGRIFPFITSDRAWSVKELRELEVQG